MSLLSEAAKADGCLSVLLMRPSGPLEREEQVRERKQRGENNIKERQMDKWEEGEVALSRRSFKTALKETLLCQAGGGQSCAGFVMFHIWL